MWSVSDKSEQKRIYLHNVCGWQQDKTIQFLSCKTQNISMISTDIISAFCLRGYTNWNLRNFIFLGVVFCSEGQKNWTYCWLLSGLNLTLNTKPLPDKAGRESVSISMTNTQLKATVQVYLLSKQLCQTHSGNTRSSAADSAAKQLQQGFTEQHLLVKFPAVSKRVKDVARQIKTPNADR